MIRLIVGLGNPGKKYQTTRHNIGFVFADLFQNNYPQFDYLKPQDFMNNSGISVVKKAKYSNIKPTEILVIHDDLDIGVGEWKLQFDRGSAGHNGVRSIVEHLGTQAFWRLRIGIGKSQEGIPTEDYVLIPFSKAEKDLVLASFAKIIADPNFKKLLGH